MQEENAVAATTTADAAPQDTQDIPPVKAVDAKVYVAVNPDHMTAEMYIEPPEGDGKVPTREDLDAALQKQGVVYGIDEAALDALAAPLYDQKKTVARGTPAEDGKDGTCTELYEREPTPQYVQREDGTVDYKQLGLIREVRDGTVLCEITLPTEGAEGTSVYGKTVKPRNGAKAVVPAGENTRLTDDGLWLESTIAGNLVFRNGRFTVDTIYRVQDVDNSTGNITFSGDVMVNGDVMDGFEIRSGGNITLRGRVGMTVIEAAGDIIIDKGINGTGKALVEAGKTVKAGFIENCLIRAAEKVTAQSIINSQVECEGDVEVMNGKGIICGGKVTAFGSVKAKEVGNESNTLTIISLGVTPKLLKERKCLVDQLADVSRHLEELAKNVAYIERLVADGRPVPPERVQILKRTQIQLPMTEKKRDQLQKAIDEMDSKMANVNTSTLTANIIYPPTKVSIGALSSNCIEVRNHCRVYKNSQGELVFGSA
ncbi:MAG: DUF342 domain-containing protein [Ruminococcaceae bacterium]|nr:DUF342 domain-containing protein [Oscillospiraceae bacterium]